MHDQKYPYMSSKNISIREDIYRKLKRAKAEDESFSDAIDRLLASRSEEHPLYDLVGILDADEAERVRERAAKFREQFDEEMERYS